MMPMQQKSQNPMTQDEREPMDNAQEEGQEPEGMDQGGPKIDGGQLQALLFERFRSLTPQEMRIFDSIITPQTVPVLFKMFPELGILFDKGSQLQKNQGQPQAGPPGAQPAPQQPPMNPAVSRGLTGV